MCRAFYSFSLTKINVYCHRKFRPLSTITKLWTIHISPRWGLPDVGYGVSINILKKHPSKNPRWCYPLVHPSLFFVSWVCVRNYEKNHRCFANRAGIKPAEIVQTIDNIGYATKKIYPLKNSDSGTTNKIPMR